MNEFEWLCTALLQLEDFAMDRKLTRFRRALAIAADMAMIDILDKENKPQEPAPPGIPSPLH